MPETMHSQPADTTSQRVARARQRQLHVLLNATENGLQQFDEIVAAAKLTGFDQHATLAVLSEGQGVHETVFLTHSIRREDRLISVVYQVKVDGSLQYEHSVCRGDRGYTQDPIWTLGEAFAQRSLYPAL